MSSEPYGVAKPEVRTLRERVGIELEGRVVRRVAPCRAELTKRGREPREILRVARVRDVDVVARICRAECHPRHAADEHEVDLVTAEVRDDLLQPELSVFLRRHR